MIISKLQVAPGPEGASVQITIADSDGSQRYSVRVELIEPERGGTIARGPVSRLRRAGEHFSGSLFIGYPDLSGRYQTHVRVTIFDRHGFSVYTVFSENFLGGMSTRSRRRARTREQRGAQAREHSPPPPPCTPSAPKGPRATLGLAATFTPEELKRAYRAALALWHPDKHHHASQATQHEAHARTVGIIAAYNVLRGARDRTELDSAQ